MSSLMASTAGIPPSSESPSVIRNPCKLGTHSFSARFCDETTIYYHVTTGLENTLLLWIGIQPNMHDFVLAAPAPTSNGGSICARITGDSVGFSGSLARKLVKRTGKFCYISSSLPAYDVDLLNFAERNLVLKMNEYPDMFC